MKYNKTIIVLALLLTFINANAQFSTNEEPVSFTRKKELPANFRSMVPIVTMPQLDMEKIAKEDEEDEGYDMPFRFGYSHLVNYDLNNCGKWFELSNGDRLWQLNIICPNALSINLCYDKFWLPDGGKFFVYSKDRKHTLGAFTSKNNKGSRDDTRGFATELVFSDDIILEYYQPKEVVSDAIISIEHVVHGYRNIRLEEPGYGTSDLCMVNVNCEEGQNWQYEKRAVARVLYCSTASSGSLITTTSLNGEPYFLTANHCITGKGKDAIHDPNYDQAVFYWDYETPGCINPIIEPTNYITTSGATVIANYGIPDFALLRLTEDPLSLDDFEPYYLGWDWSGQSGLPGVCIHHPRGDVKKISTVLNQPDSITYVTPDKVYWNVYWKQTENGHGVVNHGSSGSPLLNGAHKVIGQLRASETENCNYSRKTYYGRFSVSWIGNGISTDSIHRRLDCWLDSLNTGANIMEGLLIVRSANTISTDQQLYGNIRITSTGQLSVQSNFELMGNSRLIVENGGILIVNAGTLSNVDLDIKPGATIQIINGGIIETRYGFEAPIGANVEIIDGQIQ